MTQPTNKQVLDFIRVIRRSFHDTYIVYSYGGCFGLYTILKHVFPTAVAYFPDADKDHIVSKIGDKYYDIQGDYKPEPSDKIRKLTRAELDRWEDVSHGQRLEFMIAKYQRATNKVSAQGK